MDQQRNDWYLSCMIPPQKIPVFELFGETEAFPDVVHSEHIKDRAPTHGWKIAPHRHVHLAQIFHVETAGAQAILDDQEIRLDPNTVLFVPAQIVHAFDFPPQTQGMVQSFPLPILRSIGPASADITRALSRPFATGANRDLIGLMAHLDRLLARPGPFRSQSAVGVAHAVLATIAALNHDPLYAPTQADARLGHLDVLIAQHQAQGWTPAQYADLLGLSVGHLSRLCRDAKGVSASAYIETAVMQEASRLLAFTQLSVAEIGYRLGFGDPSYFSRRFRRMQGKTPSAYRRKFTD